MSDIMTVDYWRGFTREDWENSRGKAAAAFVLNRYETGFIDAAKQACTETGADFDNFCTYAGKAIQAAETKQKKASVPGSNQEPVKEAKPALVCLSGVEPKKMNWLWCPYIPSGSMTIIQGDPGSGKTHLGAWLAAMVTKGVLAPDDEPIEQGSVIFQSMEDGLAEGLVPRLIAAGADMSRVHCFDESQEQLNVKDLDRIKAAFEQIKDLKLFIIDPIQSYLGAGTDMNRANEVRDALKGLLSLCNDYGVALVMIGHMGKSPNKNLYRLLGSMDFIAQARSVLTVGENLAVPEERVVLPTKTSNARKGAPWVFKITDKGAQFIEFRPGLTEHNLANTAEENNSRVGDAVKFMLDLLREKPMTVREIEKAGREADLKVATLRRGRENMKNDKILSMRKIGKHGSWYWFLRGKQVVEVNEQLVYFEHLEQHVQVVATVGFPDTD